jgi:hypothetical protein
MARNPACQAPSEDGDAALEAERAPPLQSPDAGERYGPLELARTVKDDGRALILYRRADGQP